MKPKTTTELLRDFKTDKIKNANVILELMKRLEDTKVESLTSAIEALCAIFIQLLIEQDIKVQSKVPDELKTAKDKFMDWILKLYDEMHQKLLCLLRHDAHSVQKLAMCTLLQFMQTEGRNPVRKNSGEVYHFPKYRLHTLMRELVTYTVDRRQLIYHLKEYMKYQDFMFYTLMILSDMIKKDKKKNKTDVFMNNLFPLLEQIDIPLEEEYNYKPCKLFLDPECDQEMAADPVCGFTISYDKAQKALNVIWLEILKFPLSVDLYRRCLILIPERVMQHLYNPVRFTNFFMESYNMGGAISLLALQGVFILINKHNLEYPDFYTKLYALLEPNIFHAKYKPRFFILLDKFLSSSHIPEYLVAAFVKRLARLTLVAPAPSLVLVLKFIVNLLLRFPGLKKLIHNPSVKGMEDDPYDASEPDPVRSKASESSLWEVASLQNHVLPAVSKVAGFINKNLPDMEHDIGCHVETTYEEVFEYTCKIQVHDGVATTFHKPREFFIYEDNKISSAWALV
ncbi:nucleolar complex protein 4 homolog A-like isoform X1 [Penaeus chinensis]|uniref:nucleolar complex protein 4 homolog A-like isoform X1 n=1 Tax=Penaeus chinensis TaxID=139456 RepID=UPI001FB67BDC|nr:nucleolar complex protein 4 homolog A-like isoform X1 [Penaeus chinensis]